MNGAASSFDTSGGRFRSSTGRLADPPARIETNGFDRAPVADGGSYFAVEFIGHPPKKDSRVKVNVQGWDLMLPVAGGEWVALPSGRYDVYIYRGGALKRASLDLAPREAVVAAFEFSRFGITWSGWRGCRVHFTGSPSQAGQPLRSVDAARRQPASSSTPAASAQRLSASVLIVAAAVFFVLMLVALQVITGAGALVAAFIFCGVAITWLWRRRGGKRPQTASGQSA